MLVLTRKPKQAIYLGENGEVKITVLGVNGNQIRLGIEAAKHIPVYREEIYKKLYTELLQLEVA